MVAYSGWGDVFGATRAMNAVSYPSLEQTNALPPQGVVRRALLRTQVDLPQQRLRAEPFGATGMAWWQPHIPGDLIGAPYGGFLLDATEEQAEVADVFSTFSMARDWFVHPTGTVVSERNRDWACSLLAAYVLPPAIAGCVQTYLLPDSNLAPVSQSRMNAEGTLFGVVAPPNDFPRVPNDAVNAWRALSIKTSDSYSQFATLSATAGSTNAGSNWVALRPEHDLVLELTKLSVQVSNRTVVNAYLHQYSDMQPVVLALARALRARFPLPTQLTLEVYVDPEIEERHLSLYVRQARYAPDILDQIQETYMTVATDLVDKSGWIIATTDFHAV